MFVKPTSWFNQAHPSAPTRRVWEWSLWNQGIKFRTAAHFCKVLAKHRCHTVFAWAVYSGVARHLKPQGQAKLSIKQIKKSFLPPKRRTAGLFNVFLLHVTVKHSCRWRWREEKITITRQVRDIFHLLLWGWRQGLLKYRFNIPSAVWSHTFLKPFVRALPSVCHCG